MRNRFSYKEAPTPLRVFVSSTYFDLKSIRQELSQYLGELGFEPVIFETAGALPNIPAVDSALQHAAQADICILIVGSKYGSMSERSGISYTHAEYRTAMDMGRPIFAFVERESLIKFELFMSRPGAEFWTTEEQHLFKFLEEVSIHGSRFPFDNLPELKRAIRYQLSSYFGYLVRQYAMLDTFSPQSADSWNNMGTDLWERGQLGGGIYCYRMALEIDEFHQTALVNLARSLSNTGRTTEALPLLQKGIERYPYLSSFKRELSYCLYDLGRHDEAIRSAEETVELFPKDDRAWVTLLDIYRQAGHLKKAARAAKKAYELLPHDTLRYQKYVELSALLGPDEG